MSAAHQVDSNGSTSPVLYLAIEMGWTTWKLAFTVGAGQKPRLRTVRARDVNTLVDEIRQAKARFGLPADCAVKSCYEAGRDGFWLHRFLTNRGVENVVVDSSSIEVNRRARRAKSDRLDANKLVEMLVRYANGERKVWSVVRVPSVQDEDDRQLHRERMTLVAERIEHVNRIKGLLASIGLTAKVDMKFPERLEQLRQWDGSAVPPGMKGRILREFERWKFVDRQLVERDKERGQRIRTAEIPKPPKTELVRRLLALKGIGETGSWVLVHEVFGWREIKNRRELASLMGLAPSPYSSGDSQRDQGISKAGNRRVRWLMVELAWCWLRYQPESDLSHWYLQRFGRGSPRQRRIGIVALARKLLVALWRYLKDGEVPEGAEFKESTAESSEAEEPLQQAS